MARYTAWGHEKQDGPIECAVTNIATQVDSSIKLEYAFFVNYDSEATTPEKDAYLQKTSGTLLLKPTNDGSYLQYWSVEIGETVGLQPMIAE